MMRYGAAALVAAVLIGWALRQDDKIAFMAVCGAAFGALLQRSRLCFTSAFRDFFVLRDRRAALGILSALAVGTVGYAVVYGLQLPGARYVPDTAHIAPSSPVVALGGLTFGIGMVLAGG